MARGLLKSNRTRDGIAAALWDNMGRMEEDIWERQEQWDGEQQKFREMEAALEQGGLRVLNKPNLLKQNWWTNSTEIGRNVVYGTAARIAGTSQPYLESLKRPTLYELEAAPTAEQLAEACAYYEYTDEEQVTHYNLYKDEDDIKASVVDLATADQITETDGEIYDKAIQFDVTANSAYGNIEWLSYGNPPYSQKYNQGATPPKPYGQIEELIPGETYSMSFWARVISGDGAWMRFGWGGNTSYGARFYQANGVCDVSDWIDVKGSAWTRYTWRFVFNPTPNGDWFTETSETVEDVTTITRMFNWLKRVGFGIGRKFTGVVQVCGFRLVKGRLWISETYDGLEDGITENAAAIQGLESADGDIMANLADAEEGGAAARAHAVGDLFTVGNTLYRARTAIAAGETITPGTNCTAVTAENAFVRKQNPLFVGYVTQDGVSSWSYGEESASFGAMTRAGGYAAFAEGNETVATGDFAHAAGWGTVANHRSQHVFGENNVPDPSTGSSTGRGNYVEIVGNGNGIGDESNARTLDWDGNETLSGRLTLGAAPTANMHAATKKYVDDGGAVVIDFGNVSFSSPGVAWYAPQLGLNKYKPISLEVSNKTKITSIIVSTSNSGIDITCNHTYPTVYPMIDIKVTFVRMAKSYTYTDGSGFAEDPTPSGYSTTFLM